MYDVILYYRKGGVLTWGGYVTCVQSPDNRPGNNTPEWAWPSIVDTAVVMTTSSLPVWLITSQNQQWVEIRYLLKPLPWTCFLTVLSESSQCCYTHTLLLLLLLLRIIINDDERFRVTLQLQFTQSRDSWRHLVFGINFLLQVNTGAWSGWKPVSTISGPPYITSTWPHLNVSAHAWNYRRTAAGNLLYTASNLGGCRLSRCMLSDLKQEGWLSPTERASAG